MQAGALPAVIISITTFQVRLPPCLGNTAAVLLLLGRESFAKETFVGLAIYFLLIQHTE